MQERKNVHKQLTLPDTPLRAIGRVVFAAMRNPKTVSTRLQALHAFNASKLTVQPVASGSIIRLCNLVSANDSRRLCLRLDSLSLL